MQAIAREPRLMPHLHLSLQHGDDMILKRMKRRHLRDDAIRFAEEARRLRPDMTFGADIIAGFPTETEEMFQNSLRLIEECGLTWLHVFPYSRRPGTPAAKIPNQVNGNLIKDRAARLRAAGEARVQAHLAEQVGRTHKVLLENPHMGRTEQFTEVRFGTDQPEGQIVTAVDAAIDDQRGAGDGRVAPRHGQVARQKGHFKGAGHVEHVDMVGGDKLGEARQRLIDDPCMPIGFHERISGGCHDDLLQVRHKSTQGDHGRRHRPEQGAGCARSLSSGLSPSAPASHRVC